MINSEETERERNIRHMEGGCAVENIMIMANALGLGTVPIGVANLENQGFVWMNLELIRIKKLYF